MVTRPGEEGVRANLLASINDTVFPDLVRLRRYRPWVWQTEFSDTSPATLRAPPTSTERPFPVRESMALCRVHDDDLPVGVEQIDVRLIDDGPDANPNLDFVLTDTVRLIEQLRKDGCTVLLHCVACQGRTPTVAALYGARSQGISGALALQQVTSVLPNAWPNSDFRAAIGRFAP